LEAHLWLQTVIAAVLRLLKNALTPLVYVDNYVAGRDSYPAENAVAGFCRTLLDSMLKRLYKQILGPSPDALSAAAILTLEAVSEVEFGAPVTGSDPTPLQAGFEDLM
jgi:hypothetical protein